MIIQKAAMIPALPTGPVDRAFGVMDGGFLASFLAQTEALPDVLVQTPLKEVPVDAADNIDEKPLVDGQIAFPPVMPPPIGPTTAPLRDAHVDAQSATRTDGADPAGSASQDAAGPSPLPDAARRIENPADMRPGPTSGSLPDAMAPVPVPSPIEPAPPAAQTLAAAPSQATPATPPDDRIDLPHGGPATVSSPKIPYRTEPSIVLSRSPDPDTPPTDRTAPVAVQAGVAGVSLAAPALVPASDHRPAPSVSFTELAWSLRAVPPMAREARPAAGQGRPPTAAIVDPVDRQSATIAEPSPAATDAAPIAGSTPDPGAKIPGTPAPVDRPDPDAAVPVPVQLSPAGHDAGTSPTGESPAPRPAPHAAQPVATAILSHAATGPDRAVTLALSPDELGPVEVRLSQTDGALHVILSADRPETLDLLRRHAGELAQDLRQAGFAHTTFSFAQGGSSDATALPRPATASQSPAQGGHPTAGGRGTGFPTPPPHSAATGAALDLRL